MQWWCYFKFKIAVVFRLPAQNLISPSTKPSCDAISGSHNSSPHPWRSNSNNFPLEFSAVWCTKHYAFCAMYSSSHWQGNHCCLCISQSFQKCILQLWHTVHLPVPHECFVKFKAFSKFIVQIFNLYLLFQHLCKIACTVLCLDNTFFMIFWWLFWCFYHFQGVWKKFFDHLGLSVKNWMTCLASSLLAILKPPPPRDSLSIEKNWSGYQTFFVKNVNKSLT